MCRGRRVAGIQAAKRASDLIPLCHPLMVGAVTVNFEINHDSIEVEAAVDTFDRTGVEMEADGVFGRGADDLRHVQVDGQVDGDRRHRTLGEDRRQVRHVAPFRRHRIVPPSTRGEHGSTLRVW